MEPDNLSTGASPAIPAPEPPSVMSTVFLGPHGLRAGWRFAIYLAAVIGLFYALSFINLPSVSHGHGLPPLWFLLVGEGEQLAVALIPALALSRLEKRPFGDYGLPHRAAFGKGFWAGSVWGIVAITVLLVVMRGIGIFYFGGLALHGVRVLKFAAFWGLLFLLVGLFEDFLFRGYTQFTLGQGIGFWPAAVLLSLTFGGVHLRQELDLGDPPRAWAGVLAAAFIGLFFCLTLRRTGNLWFAVGMHASWDWGETFLYSVPDSGTVAPGHLLSSSFHGNPWLTGGPIGPEASVLVFVVIAAMWILFDRMYPAKRTPGS
jgi:hypothetical protein